MSKTKPDEKIHNPGGAEANGIKKHPKIEDVEQLMDEDDCAARAMLEQANASQRVARPVSSVAHQQSSAPTLQTQSPSVETSVSLARPVRPTPSSAQGRSRPSSLTRELIVIDSDSYSAERLSHKIGNVSKGKHRNEQNASNVTRDHPFSSEFSELMDHDETEYTVHPTKHDTGAWKTASFLQSRSAAVSSNVQGKGKEKAVEANPAVRRSASDVVPEKVNASNPRGTVQAGESLSKQGSGPQGSLSRGSKLVRSAQKLQSSPRSPSLLNGANSRESAAWASSSKRKLDEGNPGVLPPEGAISARSNSSLLSKRARPDQADDNVTNSDQGVVTSSKPILLNGFTMDVNVNKGEDGIKWLNWQDTTSILLKIGRLRHRECLKRKHDGG